MQYSHLRCKQEGAVCRVQLYRPEAENAISTTMVNEFHGVLDNLDSEVRVLVLEGLPEVFCTGADFAEMAGAEQQDMTEAFDMDSLYSLWLRLAECDMVTIANVKGKVNAGGVGFVAACDIVLAQHDASFGLSELLFGLMPACVLPFLMRRIGYQKAHYLVLTTKPIAVEQAHSWGLVDAFGANSDMLLGQHLGRLSRLSKPAISRYKTFARQLNSHFLQVQKSHALAANREVFSDQENLNKISRYVTHGILPWENET